MRAHTAPNRTDRLAEQFAELICADRQLLDAEFKAIITAEWPALPPTEGHYKHTPMPRRPGSPQVAGGACQRNRPPPRRPGASTWRWPRSPPPAEGEELPIFQRDKEAGDANT